MVSGPSSHFIMVLIQCFLCIPKNSIRQKPVRYLKYYDEITMPTEMNTIQSSKRLFNSAKCRALLDPLACSLAKQKFKLKILIVSRKITLLINCTGQCTASKLDNDNSKANDWWYFSANLSQQVATAITIHYQNKKIFNTWNNCILKKF